MSLEDTLAVIAKRAQMIQELPEGAMLAVALPEQETHSLLNEDLSLCSGQWDEDFCDCWLSGCGQ